MGFYLIIFTVIGLVVGVPVAFALGGAAVLAILIVGDIPLIIIPQQMMTTISGTTLLALPMFILAGNLMSKGGMSRRIVNFAMAFMGEKNGGLSTVTVLSTMIFSALTGSSSATAAAIGTIMIPEMERYKYDKSFSAAIVACSAELGTIIPPSGTMIVYGVATNTSIPAMFMAGIIPGILISITLMLVAYFTGKSKGYLGAPYTKEELPDRFIAFKEAFFALMMPVIVLGGIYGGVFTPVEAAAVAVLYGFVTGVLIYRDINFKVFKEVVFSAAKQTTMILLLISGASVFGYVLGVERIPQAIGMAVGGLTDNPFLFLLLINVILLLAGMIIESSPLMLILGPIFAPIAVSFGIDPIHFAMIFIVNVAVGMVTPPVALNLYVTCNIANLKIEQLVPKILPFFICLVIDVLLISYIPVISTFLPNLLGQ